MANPPMTDNDIAAVVSAAVIGERERCAKIALSHICTFGSMAEEIHATATAKAIAADIRNPNK